MQEKTAGLPEKRPGKYSYRRKGPVVLACLALVITLLGGLATLPRPQAEPLPETSLAIREASYPEMAQRPLSRDEESEAYEEAYAAWREERMERLSLAEGCGQALAPFLRESCGAFLTDSPEENRVFSPLSLYMALAMLTEATGGETRQQLLSLLGAEDVETLRAQAGAVWNACYCDDGLTRSVLGSSIWLDDGISFVPSTMETLAGTYYASAFQGQMGSQKLNEALRGWLNGQTANQLAGSVTGESFEPDTVVSLVSAVLYQAAWSDGFRKSDTQDGTFYAGGEELPCTFLRQSRMRVFYRGTGFSAVSQLLDDGRAQMWFLLPDEGTDPKELLEDGSAVDFLLSEELYAETALVHLSLPKFDAGGELELGDGLRSLGVVNIFSPEQSNFAPLTDRGDLYVSSIRQAARVSVDEGGCTGAPSAGEGTGGNVSVDADELEFTLDRPFLFAITTADHLPLLVGVVRQPS